VSDAAGAEPLHHAVSVPATTANLGPGFDAFGLALGAGTDGADIASLVARSVPRRDRGQRVTTAGDGADELSTGDDNLVWRSLVAFCEHHDVPVPDVALDVATGIPLERGLGSSSAAIVAGLTLARALTGVVTGDLDVVALATDIEGHPDNVAPAVLGGLVACAVTDDGQLVVRRANPAPSLRPAVLVPGARQATDSARAVLPASLSRDEVTVQAARAGHVLAALLGAWPADAGLGGDRLHEPARSAAMPASAALLASLRDAGVHAWLSGAGPTVAAVLTGSGDGHLDGVRATASEHGFACHVLRVDLAGAVACADGACAYAADGTCVRCPRRRV
jgi:homoserine kinase